MEHCTDAFKECLIESFGNSILFGSVVYGGAMDDTLETQVSEKLVAHVFTTAI